eukprot:g41893.t1
MPPYLLPTILTHRPQSVKIGNSASSTTVLNTGASQGCILSPNLLYSLYAHDCVDKFDLNSIYKYSDGSTVGGRILNEGETEYSKELECLVTWCKYNNLPLNASKTKELIINFRKHGSINISGAEVEKVDNVKFLGMTITNNLSWTTHVDAMVNKAQQHLFYLRRLRKFDMSIRTLPNLYRCTVGNIPSGCIMAWYGNCYVIESCDHDT